MLFLEINPIVGYVANYMYLVLYYLGKLLQGSNWLALRKFTQKKKRNYRHIQVTVILLDGISSPGQLIMPALTLAINLSFYLLLKLNENTTKFQQKKKKSPTIMR